MRVHISALDAPLQRGSRCGANRGCTTRTLSGAGRVARTVGEALESARTSLKSKERAKREDGSSGDPSSGRDAQGGAPPGLAGSCPAGESGAGQRAASTWPSVTTSSRSHRRGGWTTPAATTTPATVLPCVVHHRGARDPSWLCSIDSAESPAARSASPPRARSPKSLALRRRRRRCRRRRLKFRSSGVVCVVGRCPSRRSSSQGGAGLKRPPE